MKKILLIFIVILIGSPTYAEKYAGEFLYLGVGGRPLALGSAYTAANGDVFSSYYNPAGLVDIQGSQAAFMHSETFGSLLNHDFFAFAKNFRGGVAALSLYRLGGGGILVTEEYMGKYRIVEEESHVDYALYFAYGRNQSDRLDWGLTTKIIRRKIADDFSAWGIGIDAGIRYRIVEGLTGALVVQDLTGTVLSYSGDYIDDNTGEANDVDNTEVINPTMKLGLGYSRDFGDFRGTALVDIDVMFEGRESTAQFNQAWISEDSHLGLEILYKNVIAARVGSNIGDLTTGIGVKFGRYAVDLALYDHSDLDTSYRGSLIVAW